MITTNFSWGKEGRRGPPQQNDLTDLGADIHLGVSVFNVSGEFESPSNFPSLNAVIKCGCL